MDYALLTRLTETAAISGREERMRNLLAGLLSGQGMESSTDAMGNLIANKGGKGPRVALVAHMDEVGFMVSKIESQGFVRVMPVGGVDPQVFGAQKVIVHGKQDVAGVVGSVPPHLRKKKNDAQPKEAVPIEEGFIDLGLPPEQVQSLVTVGDPVTFATQSWDNPTSYFGKALDDRLGLFVMLTALKQARNIDCDLVLIASTQEEYGLRGVGPALFGTEPQVALILEGTVASDTPGLKLPANVAPTEQGKGPEIRLSDGRMLADRRLADFLVKLAQQRDIAHQMVVKNTGATDAAAGQLVARGIVAGALSVPTRYIHAPISMVRKSDIAQSVALVAAFLENASRFGD
jgi:putative aminopeptidase FrvX